MIVIPLNTDAPIYHWPWMTLVLIGANVATFFLTGRGSESDGWLLDQTPRMRGIPCRIAQGRYDMCTPMKSAWDLKQRWPEAELEVIHDAGHSSLEPGIVDALVRATDWMADRASW